MTNLHIAAGVRAWLAAPLLVLSSACAHVDPGEGPSADAPGDRIGTDPAPLVGSTSDTAAPTQHLLVQLRLQNGGFSVVRVTEVPEPLPRFRGVAPRGDWRCQAFAPGQQLLSECALPAPPAIRGEFQDRATGQHDHVFLSRSGPVDFVVRVPSQTSTIDFFDGGAPSAAGARALGSSSTRLGTATLPSR